MNKFKYYLGLLKSTVISKLVWINASIVILTIQSVILYKQTTLLDYQTYAAQFDQAEKVREQIRKTIELETTFSQISDSLKYSFQINSECRGVCLESKLTSSFPYLRNETLIGIDEFTYFENWRRIRKDAPQGVSDAYALGGFFRVRLRDTLKNNNVQPTTSITLGLQTLIREANLRCELEGAVIENYRHLQNELEPWISDVDRYRISSAEDLIKNTIAEYSYVLLRNNDNSLTKPASEISLGALTNSVKIRTDSLAILTSDIATRCMKRTQKDFATLRNLETR